MAVVSFFKQVVFANYPDFVVAWGKPEKSRQILADAVKQTSLGIPGMTVWRQDDDKYLPLFTRTNASIGRQQLVVPGSAPPVMINFQQEIPVRCTYVVSAWAKERSDANAMKREFWFAEIYKNVTYTMHKPQSFTETTSASLTHGSPSLTYTVKNPEVCPGTVAITFNSDSSPGATDNGSGYLVFTGDYAAFSGTINYGTGLISIDTNTLSDLDLSLSITYQKNVVFWTLKNPIWSDKSTDSTIDSPKTGKPLFYNVNKVFYVDSKWMHSTQYPQIRDIEVTYNQIVSGDPVTLELLETASILPNL
jgi:hypothetical protein